MDSKSSMIAKRFSLPTKNQIHFVFLKHTVGREQSHLLRERLGYEHPVKRVAMVQRQFASTQGVFMGDIERLDRPRTQGVKHEFRRCLRKRQGAERVLNSDFPCACCREIQLRR